MQQPPLFVPECYADTALMLTLLRENSANEAQLADFYNHKHGIGNVDKLLEEQWKRFGPTRRVVGLVDLDKDFQKHLYLRQFTRLLGGSLERKAHSHALLQHPTNTTQYLLVLNPAFETWLAARASELGTTLAAWGIPTNPDAFKKYSRVEGRKRHGQLRKLLAAIATARYPAYAEPASFIAAIMHLEGPLP